jgi:hypothetical protein
VAPIGAIRSGALVTVDVIDTSLAYVSEFEADEKTRYSLCDLLSIWRHVPRGLATTVNEAYRRSLHGSSGLSSDGPRGLQKLYTCLGIPSMVIERRGINLAIVPKAAPDELRLLQESALNPGSIPHRPVEVVSFDPDRSKVVSLVTVIND